MTRGKKLQLEPILLLSSRKKNCRLCSGMLNVPIQGGKDLPIMITTVMTLQKRAPLVCYNSTIHRSCIFSMNAKGARRGLCL